MCKSSFFLRVLKIEAIDKPIGFRAALSSKQERKRGEGEVLPKMNLSNFQEFHPAIFQTASAIPQRWGSGPLSSGHHNKTRKAYYSPLLEPRPGQFLYHFKQEEK